MDDFMKICIMNGNQSHRPVRANSKNELHQSIAIEEQIRNALKGGNIDKVKQILTASKININFQDVEFKNSS